ncbi:hypothetical protein ACYULU_05930 [Breznakiellaceae bacterium SP9]
MFMALVVLLGVSGFVHTEELSTLLQNYLDRQALFGIARQNIAYPEWGSCRSF